MFQAVISNSKPDEYGVATITFPIPSEDYDDVMAIIKALRVGDPHEADIKIEEVYNCPPILKRLEGTLVNLDELDHLVKRLDSFTDYEIAQFQAMAHKLDIRSVPDFINLSYCCQVATVVTDVTDLEGIGRTHLINLNGGSIAISELERADLRAVAVELLNSGAGTVTPYGVVYDNGMELTPVYDGRHLPRFHYEADILTAALTSKADGYDTENVTWIYLPSPESRIERAIRRSGIAPEQMQFSFPNSMIPGAIEAALSFKNGNIYDLNRLAECIQTLSREERDKLSAVVSAVKPERVSQVCRIAENLDEFSFAPGVRNPTDYGRYLIQETARYKYDPKLEDVYDYERLGCRHIDREHGEFTGHGYIAYPDTLRLNELMNEEQNFGMEEMQ